MLECMPILRQPSSSVNFPSSQPLTHDPSTLSGRRDEVLRSHFKTPLVPIETRAVDMIIRSLGEPGSKSLSKIKDFAPRLSPSSRITRIWLSN